jgi:hypothetical protein
LHGQCDELLFGEMNRVNRLTDCSVFAVLTHRKAAQCLFCPANQGANACLKTLDFRTLPVVITSQNKVATDAASRDKWLEQQRRKLNCGSIGTSGKHFVHAASVVLEVLLRRQVYAEFKPVHHADTK